MENDEARKNQEVQQRKKISRTTMANGVKLELVRELDGCEFYVSEEAHEYD